MRSVIQLITSDIVCNDWRNLSRTPTMLLLLTLTWHHLLQCHLVCGHGSEIFESQAEAAPLIRDNWNVINLNKSFDYARLSSVYSQLYHSDSVCWNVSSDLTQIFVQWNILSSDSDAEMKDAGMGWVNSKARLLRFFYKAFVRILLQFYPRVVSDESILNLQTLLLASCLQNIFSWWKKL